MYGILIPFVFLFTIGKGVRIFITRVQAKDLISELIMDTSTAFIIGKDNLKMFLIHLEPRSIYSLFFSNIGLPPFFGPSCSNFLRFGQLCPRLWTPLGYVDY